MEYTAVIALVAAIIAVVATADIGTRIGNSLSTSICRILQQDNCETAAAPETQPIADGEQGDPPAEPECPDGGRDRTTGRDGDRGERPGEDPRNRPPEHPDGCVPGENIPGEEEDGLTVGETGPGANGDVPGAPDPPPADEGSGEYNSEGKGIRDRLWQKGFYRIADAAEALGHTNAARHMRHYLDASGRPLEVRPENIMRDVPGLRDAVGDTLNDIDGQIRDQALEAYRSNGEQPVHIPFQSGWNGYYITPDQSADWFYAMGGISYSVTGYVTVEPPDTPGGEPKVTMHYKVHVYDRYNWDNGKKAEIGPFTVSDEDMQKLHRKGLAQEYDIHGSSDEYSRPVGDGSGNVSGPPDGDDRDGGRDDPGRGRG